MDKWEDTVMSDKEIYQAAEPYADGKFWIVDYDRAIAKAQAELSFKAGEDKGKQEEPNPRNECKDCPKGNSCEPIWKNCHKIPCERKKEGLEK